MLILVIFLLVEICFGLNNGLGRVPQMGKRKSSISINIASINFSFQVGIVGIIFIATSMNN